MSATRISIKQLLEDNGYDSIVELMEDNEMNGLDGTAPALCSEGCIVEPDGECQHGNPSWLLAAGIC